MSVKILPFSLTSQSSRDLAEALGVRRLRPEGSQWTPGLGDVVINWGSGSGFAAQLCRQMSETGHFYNNPSAVNTARDKLKTYQALAGNHWIPSFTTDRREAAMWLYDGHRVLIRQDTSGRGGVGITLVTPQDPATRLVEAPLFVKYVPKRQEYRVHVLHGQIMDAQQKRTPHEVENPNFQIRSHANGWIFARENVDLPEVCRDAATGAVTSLGLDFGAVDVGYTELPGQATVYEVNTAPGLEGTTLENYARAFRNLVLGGRG